MAINHKKYILLFSTLILLRASKTFELMAGGPQTKILVI